MFYKKKISKTAKNTIIKNYGRLKGGGRRKAPLNTPLFMLKALITVMACKLFGDF